MAKQMGMDPEQVSAYAGIIRSAQGNLEHTAQAVEGLVAASLNPLSYAVQPGGLIIAPWSIAGTSVALAQLRAAMNDLQRLAERALAEAEQQRNASAPGGAGAGGVGPTKGSKAERLKALLDGDPSPEEVAALWRASGLSEDDFEGLPIGQIAALAMLEGLPGSARDRASRLLLDYARSNPQQAYELLGFTGSETSLKKFENQIESLHEALEYTKDRSATLHGKPAVQLLGLGNHDGQLVAAISLGDIDTSDRIAVNVPGMNSDLDGIANGIAGGTEVYRSAKDEDPRSSYAIVTWYGYNSPGMNEVRSMDRADAGATQLANFLDGIHASRGVSGTPIENFSVLAHSYGSTTAAEALKQTNSRIDDFVMYGSAGIKNDTTVDQLNADTVHSTAAAGDNVRWGGYSGGVRTDPHSIDGVRFFSAEEVSGRDSVTAHDMWADGGGSFWNWGGKRGYLTEGTNSVYEIGKIVAGK